MDFELEKHKPKFYEMKISEDDSDDTSIEFISLVDKPAIQQNWVALSDENNKRFEFKVASEDKMILTGAIMIPNFPIVRYDKQTNEPYFFYATESTVELMMKKFARLNFNRNINEMHTDKMVQAYLFESWIVQDPAKDKSSLYSSEVKVGDWWGSIQITNRDYWNENIKSGKFNGFSIEGIAQFELVDTPKFSLKSEEQISESDLIELNDLLNQLEEKLKTKK